MSTEQGPCPCCVLLCPPPLSCPWPCVTLGALPVLSFNEEGIYSRKVSGAGGIAGSPRTQGNGRPDAGKKKPGHLHGAAAWP